jgi:hypothetical protein
MSELKVNKITPKTGTSIQLGESGDTITIPCGATLTNNGTATGFGLSFCTTVKTSPFTATANKGFLINTGSAVTVTLPASPSTGAEVIIVDQTGQAGTNAITIGRNGSKIRGLCVDARLGIDRGGLRLVYSGSSQGWITATAGNDATASQYISATGGTVLTCGNFKTHVFTSDSTFQVTQGSGPTAVVEYIVVAGGGSGGNGGPGGSGGGGGAGGFRYYSSLSPAGSPLVAPAGVSVSVSSYPITVGGGGTANPCISARGNNGSNSVFSSITSAGGGAGGIGNPVSPTAPMAGASGGSGGGSRGTSGLAGGTGNTPPVSPPQGNNGGANPSGPEKASAGGGGAGAVGATGGTPQCGAGNGGDGGVGSFLPNSYFGPTAPSYGQSPSPLAPNGRYFAGGGAGHGYNAPSSGCGGAGGGGTSACVSAGVAGATNTGGGASGASGGPGRNDQGGAGGSGFVAIRYRYQ